MFSYGASSAKECLDLDRRAFTDAKRQAEPKLSAPVAQLLVSLASSEMERQLVSHMGPDVLAVLAKNGAIVFGSRPLHALAAQLSPLSSESDFDIMVPVTASELSAHQHAKDAFVDVSILRGLAYPSVVSNVLEWFAGSFSAATTRKERRSAESYEKILQSVVDSSSCKPPPTSVSRILSIETFETFEDIKPPLPLGSVCRHPRHVLARWVVEWLRQTQDVGPHLPAVDSKEWRQLLARVTASAFPHSHEAEWALERLEEMPTAAAIPTVILSTFLLHLLHHSPRPVPLADLSRARVKIQLVHVLVPDDSASTPMARQQALGAFLAETADFDVCKCVYVPTTGLRIANCCNGASDWLSAINRIAVTGTIAFLREPRHLRLAVERLRKYTERGWKRTGSPFIGAVECTRTIKRAAARGVTWKGTAFSTMMFDKRPVSVCRDEGCWLQFLCGQRAPPHLAHRIAGRRNRWDADLGIVRMVPRVERKHTTNRGVSKGKVKRRLGRLFFVS